ncbi:transposase [Sphingomonas bacterium]|uniref:IS66-like element accessory protein TnpA n=1 Tax=Sphingomonas bacterium TaxID=1895847 RepID=UPI0015776085|nr:transposase [Sphingomonas bacterium]
MARVMVMSGPERRRRWGDDERARILSEAFSPGACVVHVARRNDVSTSLIYTWRRKLRLAAGGSVVAQLPDPGFAEAIVVDDGTRLRAEDAAVVLDLADGGRLRIFASASPALAAAALKAMR